MAYYSLTIASIELGETKFERLAYEKRLSFHKQSWLQYFNRNNNIYRYNTVEATDFGPNGVIVFLSS